MKKILIMMLASVAFVTIAHAVIPVSPYSLPGPAQRFLRQNFSYAMPIEVTRENAASGYLVMMNDNSIIEFDRTGLWIEARCNDGVPESVLPQRIKLYLKKRFEDELVTRISKVFATKTASAASPSSYEVELATGMTLVFDSKGVLSSVK
ncbi:MAG: PepSY-like domain-containing protein [Bacteroidales bacterium]|nr:PepSY-like domain-containing protein [Bacteroidales bacterium]